MIRKIYIALMVCLYLPADAAYYRWTDDDGKTHYSYSVPAEKSQLGYVELSKQGIKTKEVISAKRNRQIKELADLQKLRKKQNAEEEKEKEFQQAEDKLLLSIFNSENELSKAYNTKLQLAQLTIDILKTRHKKQSGKLEVLEQKHERMVDIAHKQALEKQIDVVLDNLKIYQQAITENLIEKDKVNSEYKATLNRYKNLMARSSANKQ